MTESSNGWVGHAKMWDSGQPPLRVPLPQPYLRAPLSHHHLCCYLLQLPFKLARLHLPVCADRAGRRGEANMMCCWLSTRFVTPKLVLLPPYFRSLSASATTEDYTCSSSISAPMPLFFLFRTKCLYSSTSSHFKLTLQLYSRANSLFENANKYS
jgi:hypothetical protein